MGQGVAVADARDDGLAVAVGGSTSWTMVSPCSVAMQPIRRPHAVLKLYSRPGFMRSQTVMLECPRLAHELVVTKSAQGQMSRVTGAVRGVAHGILRLRCRTGV